MKVIVLMLAGGPGVTRWGQRTLPWCAQGGTVSPLDAWSVEAMFVFRVVQILRSTDPTFASIFGVSTQLCVPVLVTCFVVSSCKFEGLVDPPHLGFSAF